ncbi:rhomboid family intramembrane serine protease [bacterium]|nr:rhomboid family intramembrane serine protease [bacterium]
MSYCPPLTLFLIAVNVFVYFWEISAGALQDEASIIRSGALYRDLVMSGEVWRLVSAMFLHASQEHLFANCALFYIVGMASEHAFGLRQAFQIYGVSGLAGSVLSVIFSAGPAVGASGAIFGVMASVIVFFHLHKNSIYVEDHRIGFVLAILAGYEIVSGVFVPFVDNFAHLGGFVGGAWAARYCRPILFDAD